MKIVILYIASLLVLVGCSDAVPATDNTQIKVSRRPVRVIKEDQAQKGFDDNAVRHGPVGDARGTTGKSDPEQEVRKLLRSWDRYRKEWTSASDLVILAKYRRSSYPCIFFAGGGSAMPTRSVFNIVEVIKGEINRQSVDINLAGLSTDRFPRDFVSGRNYLVFLKPSKESKKILNDPKSSFSSNTQMKQDELVAILDISSSKVEVDAENVVAHRRGEYKGFEFTPDRWRKLREAKGIDLAAQKTFIPFIMHTVLSEKATIAHVRSYLGKPDHQYMNTDGTYYEYRLNVSAPMPHGTVSGRLELHFRTDTELKGYYIRFYKHIEDRTKAVMGSNRYIRELNSEELKKLGLKMIDRYDP